jgi:DNA-binding response OmpR family regulator
VNGQEIVVSGKVFKGNTEVQAAPLELRLIACLKREPKIYTKDEIAHYVYYEEEGIVIDNRIENLVRQVRKRLDNPQYIKAHWGQGYEFINGC